MDTKKKFEEAAENLGINEEMSEQEEFDLVTGFLKAAEDLSNRTKVIVIQRNGKKFFKFRIRAISEHEMNAARKKATSYMANPKNKKLPPIEKDHNYVDFKSYLIYLATVDEDKAKLWDNPELKNKFDVMEGYNLVDKVLLPGEKDDIIEVIDELIGYSDDEYSNDIDIAKN